MHYNRVLGRGGAEIAKAIKATNELQILDISYNTIGGGHKKKVQYAGQNERKDIDSEEEKEDPLIKRALELMKDDHEIEPEI